MQDTDEQKKERNQRIVDNYNAVSTKVRTHEAYLDDRYDIRYRQLTKDEREQ
jgi:hypothetical protein